MIPAHEFRSLIVEPAEQQFRKDPASLLHAFSIIWAIDAYASHVLFGTMTEEERKETKKHKKREADYKDRLMSSQRGGSWEFRVVHEVSNAGKHALRSKTDIGVPNSRAVSTQRIEGWLHFFMNPHETRCGEQIVVELDPQYQVSHVRFNSKGEPLKWPFPWVPVYNIISPSLALIDATKS